jgi:hypothetical protein
MLELNTWTLGVSFFFLKKIIYGRVCKEIMVICRIYLLMESA